MEDSSYVSRPYVPTHGQAVLNDPFETPDYSHVADGGPANVEYGYDPPVVTHNSKEVFKESHGWSNRACSTAFFNAKNHVALTRANSAGLRARHGIAEDPLDHADFATGARFSRDPATEGYIHNPMRTDCAENRSEDERNVDLDVLRYLQNIGCRDPQMMRRFVMACMEKSVTEKDLLWMYHMRDFPQNGTLPIAPFVAITKQHLNGNSQLTLDKDYEILAMSYSGFTGDLIRYVDLCNDLHSWRVLNNDYKEFPIRQIYPAYRYPQTEHYPRPPQGDWHLDRPRRESHQLPTMTFDELKTIPLLVRRIGESLYHHHRFDALERKFHELEKLKEDKTVECGLIPHDYVKQALKEIVVLDISDSEMFALCLYYEHPYVLHFFRYHDFLLDAKFEMAVLNPKFKQHQTVTRKTTIMDTLKRYIHNSGLNFLEPFQDFDSFGQGHLNRSHMKRALHVLRIGPGQRCDMSKHDLDFLLEQFCDNGETINYKKLNGELMQVFTERFEPGGRLAMVMESFEPNLARGPYYPPRAPLMAKDEILGKSVTDEEVLRRVIDRLKMLVVERRIHLEPIFRIFDPHNIRYVQNVLTFTRILQLAGLPASPEEVDVLIEKFADKKGFRYQEFLQAIDTQSYAFRLATYPVTLATMEQWKNKRSWYPEVVPQDVYQNYQGPEGVVEKCRRKVSIDRLNVIDFFRDYDIHNHGVVTRKQFRRATAHIRLRLSPMENLILENRYAYPSDIALLDYSKFLKDMDLVFSPKDPAAEPAKIPEHYKFQKVNDRPPIGPAEVALAQEGFRKLCEKLLELRIHIEPYFHDFDPWRRGGVTQERFRRILNAIGLDVLTEVEWKALFRYFARPSQAYFDYRAFLDKVSGMEKKRERNIVDDPRFGPVRS